MAIRRLLPHTLASTLHAKHVHGMQHHSPRLNPSERRQLTDAHQQPSIIKDLGYSAAEAQLLTIPPYVRCKSPSTTSPESKKPPTDTLPGPSNPPNNPLRHPFRTLLPPRPLHPRLHHNSNNRLHHPSQQQNPNLQPNPLLRRNLPRRSRDLPLSSPGPLLAGGECEWADEACDGECDADHYRECRGCDWNTAL